MHAHTHLHTCTNTHTHIHTHMHAGTHARPHTLTHTHMTCSFLSNTTDGENPPPESCDMGETQARAQNRGTMTRAVQSNRRGTSHGREESRVARTRLAGDHLPVPQMMVVSQHTCIHTHVYTHAYTHAYTYAYTHAHMHTHTRTHDLLILVY